MYKKALQRALPVLSILTFGLLKVPTAFADIPSCLPVGMGGDPNCVEGPRIRYHSNPTLSDFTLNDAKSISVYVLLTIVFEAPIFYLFGFKSKKALLLVAIVNVISVSIFHILDIMLGGQLSFGIGLWLAELLIVIFESVILILFLRKEIPIKKIIIATVAANVVSAVIGGYIVNTLLGGIR